MGSFSGSSSETDDLRCSFSRWEEVGDGESSAIALDRGSSVNFTQSLLLTIPDAEGPGPKPEAPSQAEPREEPCVWEQRDPEEREILMDPDTGDRS